MAGLGSIGLRGGRLMRYKIHGKVKLSNGLPSRMRWSLGEVLLYLIESRITCWVSLLN